MEQKQGETNMVDNMIDGFLNPMTKEEFRAWEDYVIKYNHDNPTDQMAYEVNWKDDIYKVKLLNLKVDNEG
jgi:hypothetical protein